MHCVSPRSKVIAADSPLARTSRPRISGPQLFSFDGETLSVTTTWPVLLTTVKFCRAWPCTSAVGVPPPAGARAPRAAGGARAPRGARGRSGRRRGVVGRLRTGIGLDVASRQDERGAEHQPGETIGLHDL